MEIIQKKDFIEVEYTGIINDNNTVFDTTNADTAKLHNLPKNASYGPAIICVGEHQILKGLDHHLENKEVGKEHQFEIKAQDAFGMKDSKLLKLIPGRKFHEQKVQPIPGLQIDIDGMQGTIKTVSGGRVLVDFNHPLAGKDLKYTVKVNKKITDTKQQLDSALKAMFGLPQITTEITEKKATITMPFDIPADAQAELQKKLTGMISGIEQISFAILKGGKK